MRVLLLVLLMSFSVDARSYEHTIDLPPDCLKIVRVDYYQQFHAVGTHCQGNGYDFFYLSDGVNYTARKNLVIQSKEVDAIK